MDDDVVLLSQVEQSASALDVARCQFDGDGHHWLDVTTVVDVEPRFWCGRCGAKGKGRGPLRLDENGRW